MFYTKVLLLVALMVFYIESRATLTTPGIEINVSRFDPERYDRLVENVSLGYDTLLKVKRLLLTGNGEWEMGISQPQNFYNYPCESYRVCLKLIKGKEENSAIEVALIFNDWDREGYLMLPASAYNGNRYDWRKIRYSPKLNDDRDLGKDSPIIISDVPKLTKGNLPSFIQERSGSLSYPFVGMYKEGEICGITFPYRNSEGDIGVNFEELKGKGARVSFRSPLIREIYKYEIADHSIGSEDKPRTFLPGDSVVFEFSLYNKEHSSLSDLFALFFDLRMKNSKDNITLRYPFSECYNLIKEKFNCQNFVQEYGYYSVGMRENFLQDWQIGWTGGMITTYPLLFSDDTNTINNVVRNFDWLFPNGLSPSGFFWDSGEKGNKWYGGDIRRVRTSNWHLVRKSGDALYYIIRQFQLMGKKGISVKDSWQSGTKKVADAFVTLYEKYGQYGQFIDSYTGDIIVGGSTSGAIVPAALVLVSEYFHELKYLETAKHSAQQMYDDYISKGISCGGPGDAMQNADSESWYSMLESFMLLYEFTNESKWLEYAEETAKQFSTWVMAYNYGFPQESLFGGLNMETTGAVFANTQNKHGSPGICTHSGIALLKLYQATNDERYAVLLSQISRCIPNYMSHYDRPVAGMPPGWINERISTTDWFEGIGEINPGSTWAETAMLLSAVELPSVYLDLSNNNVFIFDHLNAEIKENGSLLIENPTQYPSKIKIWVNKRNIGNFKFWNPLDLHDREVYTIMPGETLIITKDQLH